ncbi:MAG: hypothetical protein WDZ91_11850 [Paenibacillaceae bacterium]
MNNPMEGQGNIELGQAMISLVQADEVVPLQFTLDGRMHPIINFYLFFILIKHLRTMA